MAKRHMSREQLKYFGTRRQKAAAKARRRVASKTHHFTTRVKARKPTARRSGSTLLAAGLGGLGGLGAAGVALGLANRLAPGNNIVQTIDHALGVMPTASSPIVDPTEATAVAVTSLGVGPAVLAAGSPGTINPDGSISGG